MERFIDNFVLAMALCVLETWEQTQAREKSRAIHNHPILHEEALDAREVVKLFDQKVHAHHLTGFPHGLMWNMPIEEVVEA